MPITLKGATAYYAGTSLLANPESSFRVACSGTVSVALGRDLAIYFAPQFATFCRKYPNIRLTILAKSSEEAASLISDDAIDIGISRLSKMPRGLQKKTVIANSLYVAFSKQHSLSGKKRISLSDTAPCRLITHARDAATRNLIEASYAAKEIEITDVLEVGTCEAIIEFVRLGLGIGYVHDICLPRRIAYCVKLPEVAVYGRGFGTVEYEARNATCGSSEGDLLPLPRLPKSLTDGALIWATAIRDHAII